MRYEIDFDFDAEEGEKAKKRCDPISPPLAYVAGLIDLGSQPQPVQFNRQVNSRQSNCQDDGDKRR